MILKKRRPIPLNHGIRCIIAVIVCVLPLQTTIAKDSITLSDPSSILTSEVLNKVKMRYGELAMYRLIAWKELINQNQQLDTDKKLKMTNDFFNNKNRFTYSPDKLLWGKADYWATPIEFIIKGAGDCEDYAIAKFFTLLALGVTQEQLRLAYVYLLQVKPGANKNQAHIVLSYYKTPAAVPLVLDNIIKAIKPATERPDLKPVLTFNGLALWQDKERQEGIVRSPKKIRLWVELNERSLKELTS